MIIYVTGVTGFLGKELLRKCLKNTKLDKIYCPIRSKYDNTGKERFTIICNGLEKEKYDTTILEFIEPVDTIPSDTDVVIFNAFSVSFSKTISENIRDNVNPIISKIKELNQRDIHVLFISTAYVQPPQPHKLHKDVFKDGYSDKGLIELYHNILDNKVTWKYISERVENKHFVQNTYIYSKLLTENLCKIYCREMDISLTIIRPSQIIGSSDSKYSNGKMGALSNVVRALCSPLIWVLISNSRVNIIPVDYVAEVIHNNIEQINKDYSVVYATCNEVVTPLEVMRYVNPKKRILVFAKDTLLCRMIRKLELNLCRMLMWFRILSYKRYRLLVVFYRDYIYFQNNSWKFEPNMRVTGESVLSSLKDCAISNRWIV